MIALITARTVGIKFTKNLAPVDHIMETERRSVTFSDLAEFVHNEARVP